MIPEISLSKPNIVGATVLPPPDNV